MRIYNRSLIQQFWRRHPDARGPLEAWYEGVSRGDWDTPAKLVEQWPRVSSIGSDRAVFRIKGNSYRLVARINYSRRIVYIVWLGTHDQYDRIDAKEVQSWQL